MTQKSDKKSAKKYPKYRYQPGLNGKPGRGFVVLNGERKYLEEEYESAAGWKEYWNTVEQWDSNGRNPLPTHIKTGVSVAEVATKFLGWAIGVYKNQTQQGHCKAVVQFLIDRCGSLSVDDFTRHRKGRYFRWLRNLIQAGLRGTPQGRVYMFAVTFARLLYNR